MSHRLTVTLLFVLLFASRAFGQTIAIHPDSGTAGSTVQVTIAGSGTKFKPSHTVSGFSNTFVSLKRSGQTYLTVSPTITNDSLLWASFALPASLVSGRYDLSVVRAQDSPIINYSLPSAFLVNPAPGKITAITKSYGYSGQTMRVVITGSNTQFSALNGQVTISFKQAGSVVFQTYVDSFYSATQLVATVNIPSNATGTFDVQVQSSGFNYSGSQLFTVYADPGQQSITVTPDSGVATSSIAVTIVGSGTHFTATGNISGFSSTEIDLQGYHTTPTQIVNDTLMYATFSPPASMWGHYDVTVRQTQPPYYTVTKTKGFYIAPAPPKILSFMPKSAYQGQTLKVQLNVQNIELKQPRSQLSIDFQQAGVTMFRASIDTQLFTAIVGTVTVPSSAPAGVYDISITDSGDVYTGLKLFTVLGPVPGITISPDSGISGDTIAVTIIGQNTNFQPSQGISVVNTITLRDGGQVYLQTTSAIVTSATSMNASFDLSQVAAGTYDVELNLPSSYHYVTKFTVIPHSFIVPAKPKQDTIRGGGNISIVVIGHNTHFLPIGSTVSTAWLVNPQIGPSSAIAASSLMATNDTDLTANFTVSPSASVGTYDLVVMEPSGVRETLTAALIVQASSGVNGKDISAGISNVRVSPNPAHEKLAIAFDLGTRSHVQLQFFDALGNRVGMLCNTVLPAGAQRFDWDANVPDATYFYELLAGTERRTGKIVVAK